MAKSDKTAKLEYAERLKAFRRVADVSQENLAKAIGAFQPYIASIESGTLSIGIDKQEEIAAYFGMKHYEFSNPNCPIPSKSQLRENIQKYVKSTNTEAGYLNDETPNYAKYIDELLQTDFLRDPKTSKEISIELNKLYSLEVTTTRISDILTRLPRKNLVTVTKSTQGRGNKYQLKK